jgi:ligand-binding sensor domain-containing protein
MPPNSAGRGLRAVLALSFLFLIVKGQQFAYEPGDIQYIPSTAAITSVSEGPDGIYFSTVDGLLFFDNFTQQMEIVPDLNMGLPSHTLYHVYYDPTTEGLWVVYDGGVAYRLETEEVWHEVSHLALPDFFRGRSVTRLGGAFNGIWVDMGGVYTQLNSFTGDLVQQRISIPNEPVNWNVSQSDFYTPPNLMGWITSGEWTTNISEFNGPGFTRAVPTLLFRDQYDQYWIGTDVGVIFRGDPNTRQLEDYQVGISPKPVITMYVDGDRMWFADNPFRRMGASSERKEGYFLSRWDERIASWRHYSSLLSEAIRDAGINDMLRVGKEMWLATMDGIVLLNTRNETWRYVSSHEGLRDPAVWAVEQYEGEVFVATIKGVDRINPSTRTIIPEDSVSYSPPVEVYCLETMGNTLYAGTALGIYTFQKKNYTYWRRISGLPATSLWGDQDEIFAIAHNRVYHQKSPSPKFDLYPIQPTGGPKILEITGHGAYIWLATASGAFVFDRREHQKYMIGRRDGLPSEVIYSIKFSDDWVWFITREGVVRMKWEVYFD